MIKSALGLTSVEAKKRISEFGPNEIDRKSKVSAWNVFLSQFKSPLVYVLLIAAIVTFVMKEFIDTGVIMVAVIVNAVLGFTQEFKAEKSLEALAQLIAPSAKVMRDGKWQVVPAANLVPGDVVRLSIGKLVPADGVLIHEDGMFVSEAILTGESVAVEKKSGSEVFMGTVIERGIGDMEILKTGQKTRMGGIALSVKSAGVDRTPLQIKLSSLAKKLAIFVGFVALFVLIAGLAVGDEFVDIFPTAVALAVAAIPEGLVVSLTLILTVGMRRILNHKALVRRLLAAETLGGVDVICVDKTGTLTEGIMKAVGVVTGIKKSVSEQIGSVKNQDQSRIPWIVRAMILCNDLRDPLETAMDAWGRKHLYLTGGKDYLEKIKRIDELPFDQNFKYIVTRHVGFSDSESNGVEFVSGAPEVVLSKCNLSKEEIQSWHYQFENLGNLGYRLVGFGYKTLRIKGQVSNKIKRESVKNYKWLGVIVYKDPIRKGVKAALKKARRAGIDIKVITGDYKETAWAVARSVGLVEGVIDENKVVLGADLVEDGNKDVRVENGVVFARTSPEQKLSIVSYLQRKGHVVAMTGDGVNDAPALKMADIGIVVGDASDVSREAADLVLLDSNFSTILEAVEEGRGILDNLRKVILYLLADAFAEVFLVIVSIIFFWPLPLLAVQILWINLISDGLPYLALTVEPKEAGLLKRKPETGSSILDRRIIFFIILISITSGLFASGLFYWYRFVVNWELDKVSNLVFVFLAIKSLIYIFSSRNLDKSLWKTGLFHNKWLVFGVLGGLMMVLMVMYVPILQEVFETGPLDFISWIVVLGLSFILVGVIECFKKIKFKKE
jgi:P-type Ca2+ transporter type 2C